MRSIKINQNILNYSPKILNGDGVIISHVENGDSNFHTIKVECPQMHSLNTGDKVLLRLYRDEKFPIAHDFNVMVIDNKTFMINIPLYQMVEVENYSSINDKALLVLKNGYIYNYVKDINAIKLMYGDITINGYINDNQNNEEDLTAEAIICDKQLGFTGKGFIILYCDWFLGDDNLSFNNNIVIEDANISLDVSIIIDNNESCGLEDEAGNVKRYLEDVKTSIIPEIVDNEKRQFSPVIKTKRDDNKYFSTETYYHYANEIEINLHFRDRTDSNKTDGSLREGWKTTDSQYWNNIKTTSSLNDSGNTEGDNNLSYLVEGYIDDFADELNCLGFVEDDVRFSKMKLRKSFLRLMFYSSREMLSKDLLCYSTIFMDIGDLFKKYVLIKGRGLSCFDSKRTDDNLRLSAQFNIRDKFGEKSSEGFYLYLFPDELKNENTETDIYMKVEFNHAGYGKIVPMMLPTTENGKEIIKATDNDFPLNFLKKNNGKISTDFEKYQEYMMIPLKIWYDKKLNDYVYTFPFLEDTKQKIILNLFEPRVLGYEG